MALVVTVGVIAESRVALAKGGPKEVPFTEIPHSTVQVFMSTIATQAEVTAVETRIRHMSRVRRFAFLDHAAALSEFQHLFNQDVGTPRLVLILSPT